MAKFNPESRSVIEIKRDDHDPTVSKSILSMRPEYNSKRFDI